MVCELRIDQQKYLRCFASTSTKYRFAAWMCDDCKAKRSIKTCNHCKEIVPIADVCRDVEGHLAHRDKTEARSRNIHYCNACSRPKCDACGQAQRDLSECQSDRSDDKIVHMEQRFGGFGTEQA